MDEDDDTEAESVACTFWDHNAGALRIEEVTLHTTLGPKSVAIRHACQDVCRARGYPLWAQPVDDGAVWLVFRMDGRAANLVNSFPHKEAAEMWVLHHGAC